MAEAVRDEELAVGDAVELVALPLPVGGGVGPQVHRDVPDAPDRAAHQLRLAALQVDAAQDAGARAAVVVLHEAHVDAERRHLALAERLDEEAALVAVHIGIEEDEVGNAGLQPPERHYFSALPYWRS